MSKGNGTTKSIGSKSASAARSTSGGDKIKEATKGWLKMVENATTQEKLMGIKETAKAIFEKGQVDYENAKIVIDAAHARMVKLFKMPTMPKKYERTTFSFDGKEYTISRTPTGFGSQQNSNGRFTLAKPDGGYHDFTYGHSFSGYTSPREAYNELKAWVKKYYIK